MPKRTRVKRLFPIALGPVALADALGVHHRVFAQMIADGLPVYRPPSGTHKRRVLVSDVVEHIKAKWVRES